MTDDGIMWKLDLKTLNELKERDIFEELIERNNVAIKNANETSKRLAEHPKKNEGRINYLKYLKKYAKGLQPLADCFLSITPPNCLRMEWMCLA
jgi:hypothetical protein